MTPAGSGPPAAVIFDLDGVLGDLEQLWSPAKEELVERLLRGR